MKKIVIFQKSPKALPNKHKVEYISSFDKEIFNLTNDLRKKTWSCSANLG